jgi:chemotaxis protein methyltransferase CheR
MTTNQSLLNGLQAQFTELIVTRTGLHIPPRDVGKLQEVIAARMRYLHLSEAREYFKILARDGAQNRQEWEEFTGPLTTGESYFFRDQGQFALLRTRILPEIIERNRRRRSLRIWSAGCSTGEEPYSLAILVAELLPEYNNWDVFLLGTDLNKVAVEKARRGLYSGWSLRGVSQDIKARYFHPCLHGWELDARIRSLAHFRSGNLFQDTFPSKSSGVHDFDLIVCRNVFIYFDRQAVSTVLHKFAQSLNDNGYLLTGHAEVSGLPPRQLRARRFPESLVYQREQRMAALGKSRSLAQDGVIARASVRGSQPQSLHDSGSVLQRAELATAKRAPLQQHATLQEAEQLVLGGNYQRAIAKLERLLQRDPDNLHALILSAQAQASLGLYEEATRQCRHAMTVDSLAVLPYYLLAHIAEHQGDLETAKALFKKALYLDPAFTPAYLELGALHEREGDTDRARKLRSIALDCLRALPPRALVNAYDAMTVGELQAYVEKLLAETRSLEP